MFSSSPGTMYVSLPTGRLVQASHTPWWGNRSPTNRALYHRSVTLPYQMYGIYSCDNSSRECRKALTTSQSLQILFVEIGDEHIFKLKIQKGTWSYLLSIGDRESHFFFLPDDINLDLRAFLHSRDKLLQ